MAVAQSDYRVVTVADGGTIEGTVKWVGPVPKLPKLPINKDEKICDPDPAKTRDLDRLLIGVERRERQRKRSFASAAIS